MDQEEAIRRFLGDRPESAQLGEWRDVLEQRLRGLQEELQRQPGDPIVTYRVRELRKQIDALREEEAITSFVEDSVRVTLALGGAGAGYEEETEASQ